MKPHFFVMPLRFLIVLFLWIFIIGISLYLIESNLRNGLGDVQEDLDLRKYEAYERFFRKVREGNTFYYEANRTGKSGIKFPFKKSKDSFRIFILGGSVAEGFSDFYIREDFQKIIPHRKIEVINCGIGGNDSYIVDMILEEVLNYKPDLVIVMSGHNEYHSLNENRFALRYL